MRLCGIQDIFLVAEFGILGFGIENLATAKPSTTGIRNPVPFLNPESTLEFRIQDYLGFPFMG